MWFVAIVILFVLVAGRREAAAAAAGAIARKDGVTGTIRPEMVPVVTAVQNAWRRYGLVPPVITSITDGQHKNGSLHYAGLALDFRLKDIHPAELHEVLANEVENEIGNAFDVVHEYHGGDRDHLHVEFDP